MDYELISEEEYVSLTDEDDRCFVEFENICRRNMTRMIDQNTSGEFDREVREQYMVSVSKVAEACHVPNISYDPTGGGSFQIIFSHFCLAVQGEVTRIRISSRGGRHPYSVILIESTRTKIEHYISRIRDLVDKSDMEADRKQRLSRKLDEFSEQLSGQRLSFAKTLALLAAVSAAMASVVTIGAEGPNAVAHIIRLIGEDKETEQAASNRLAPPPKALPKPHPKTTGDRHKSTQHAIDLEDIPF